MEHQYLEEVLVPSEARKLLQQMIGSKQTIMSCAIARIYTARSESEWIYSNLQGILCLIWDREMENTPFLRLFDIESFDLLFEMEMYIDFQKSYATLTPSFSFFQFQSAMIGIRFASDLEAREFNMKIMHQSLKSADMEEEAHKEEASNQKTKQKSGGLFGIRSGAKKLLGFFTGSTNDDHHDVQISKPIQVQHDLSLQFDIKTNQVDLSNLPEEWLKIFERAGISRKDLSDEELAPDIFECVCKFQSKMQLQQSQQSQSSSTSADNQQHQSIPEAPQIFIPQAPPLNIPNIPQAPPLNIPQAPPLNIPSAPPFNIPPPPMLDMNDNSNSNSQSQVQPKRISVKPKEPEARTNMLDQIKNGQFHLRKVEINSSQNKANLEISPMDGKQQEDLSLYLSRCIAERRRQLRKNHHSSSEESSSDDD